MSQTDSFVEEVSEELRRDRLFSLARRWGPYVIAVLVLVVAASAFYEWRDAQAETARQQAGDALRAAMSVDEPEARIAALEALEEDGFPAQLPLALALATARAEAGQTDAAEASLRALIDAPETDEIYADMARLRLLALRPGRPVAERLELIEPLVRPEAPFGPLGLEQRAIAQIELGELDAAREDLFAILADPGASVDLRTRAQTLLVAIGLGAAETPVLLPSATQDPAPDAATPQTAPDADPDAAPVDEITPDPEEDTPVDPAVDPAVEPGETTDPGEDG
ncbi:MAG: tetratricopeptide repeat protein [Pseudomonadota bacterium]